MTIADRIKQLRSDKKLSQLEFAEKIHRDKSLISKLESGEVDLSPMVRLAICNIFAVKKEWLLEGDGEMYDDRWELLEQRAKELGEDIYHKLALLKATKKGHENLLKEFFDQMVELPQERKYLNKLSEIFRTKDEGTKSAIMQNIDTFLKVPDAAPAAGTEPSVKKKKKA